MSCPASCRRSRGFSIVEALLSIIIASSVILTLLGIVPYAFNEVQINASQVQAIALGQKYLDTLHNAEQSNQALPAATTAPLDQGDSYLTGVANSSSSVFTITPNACPTAIAGPTASQYDCAVTVTWTENGRNESITVEDNVTR